MISLHRGLILVTAATLAACASNAPLRPAGSRPDVVPVYRGSPAPAGAMTPVDGAAPAGEKDFPPAPDEIPPGIEHTPDAVPVPEDRSATGNSKSYEVLGRTYDVLDSSKGFKQRGYASWYGKKFHGRKTASGERYNMFKMTAAHKTLPLPTYVRVTDLDNGKSVVVKVNDRGPFHSDRIIDLSYAAAAKLGLIGHGTSKVQIEAIDTGSPPPPASPDTTPAEPVVAAATPALIPAPPAETSGAARPGYLQVAAYIDPINAVALREELERQGIGPLEIHVNTAVTPPMHRVLVGPFRDQDSARGARDQLSRRSLSPQWVKD